MQTTTNNTDNVTDDRRENPTKSWGRLSYYSSSQQPTSGMIDDPSKVASIDAAQRFTLGLIHGGHKMRQLLDHVARFVRL